MLPFFPQYRSVYYLDFHLGKSAELGDRNGEMIDYNLKTSYTKGFIPLVGYYRNGYLPKGTGSKARFPRGSCTALTGSLTSIRA